MNVTIGNLEIEKDGVKLSLTLDEAKELNKKLCDVFWPKIDLTSGSTWTTQPIPCTTSTFRVSMEGVNDKPPVGESE